MSFKNRFHTIDNGEYQQRFAQTLVNCLGVEGAAQICRENYWDGTRKYLPIRKGFRTAILSLLIALMPTLAIAAPCAERAELLGYFNDKYKEAPVSMGLMADGRILEVLTSENGTWTIIVTKASGVSCGLASGQAWMKRPPPKTATGEVNS